MPRDWDAATYDRIADPMFRWGTVVVDRLELDGGEAVLDAGCGSGRVTEVLAERLPRGRVIALDGSPSMLDQARERLARFGDRVTFVEANLAAPLPLQDPVDAILSTATFHWIRDHDALFANLAAVIRPGGRLEAQCGGAGNVESIGRALAELGLDPIGSKRYAGPEETTERLERGGFEDVECWLHAEPTQFDTLEHLETYLATVILGDRVAAMAPEEGRAFVHEVAVRMPGLEIGYVRLNIRATRAATDA